MEENIAKYFLKLYLLTYWRSWALLEKLPIVQLLKNFTAFYGTRRFITVFTRAIHWSLSWASLIQSIPSHPISLRSILILSTHLCLGLLAFPPISYAFLFSPFVLHDIPISSSLTLYFFNYTDIRFNRRDKWKNENIKRKNQSEYYEHLLRVKKSGFVFFDVPLILV
jgi:hypothetical protein